MRYKYALIYFTSEKWTSIQGEKWTKHFYLVLLNESKLQPTGNIRLTQVLFP